MKHVTNSHACRVQRNVVQSREWVVRTVSNEQDNTIDVSKKKRFISMSAQPQRGSKHVVEAETKVCLNPTTSKHYGIHVVNCTHVNKANTLLSLIRSCC